MVKKSHMNVDLMGRFTNPEAFVSKKYVNTCQIDSQKGGGGGGVLVVTIFLAEINFLKYNETGFFSKFLTCLERNPSDPKTKNPGK